MFVYRWWKIWTSAVKHWSLLSQEVGYQWESAFWLQHIKKTCRAGHFQFCGCMWHLQNIVALQPCLLQSKTSASLTDSLIKNKWKHTVGWFPLVLHGRTTEQPNNVPFCSSNFIVILHHRALGWFLPILYMSFIQILW